LYRISGALSTAFLPPPPEIPLTAGCFSDRFHIPGVFSAVSVRFSDNFPLILRQSARSKINFVFLTNKKRISLCRSTENMENMTICPCNSVRQALQ
jgi:hypothetical protein